MALTARIPADLIQSAAMTTAEAGIVASTFQILGLLGCFGIPLMATRGQISSTAQTAGYLVA